VLGRLGRSPGDQHPQVGGLAERGPHLLTVDDPLVTVELRLGGETGQVGAGTGLAEQLAPRRLPRDDVVDKSVDLLAGPVVGDGRRGEQQPETVGRADRAEGGDLIRDLDSDGPGHAPPVRALGQRWGGPPRGAQALPPLGHRELGVPASGQPTAQLVEQLVGVVRFLGRVGHAGAPLGHRSPGGALGATLILRQGKWQCDCRERGLCAPASHFVDTAQYSSCMSAPVCRMGSVVWELEVPIPTLDRSNMAMFTAARPRRCGRSRLAGPPE
jgi:hypothetical protein